MNIFEKIVYFLQFEVTRPKSYGLFHLAWLICSVILIILLTRENKSHHEKNLKIILLVYGLGSLILEILKQIIWSFNYDTITGAITWDYQWYAFPFQLCTTPIFISLIAVSLKKGKTRDNILAYLALITVLGSLATALYPESCFVKTLLVDIHTMYLHFGSLVVSFYLLITKEVKLTFKNLLNGYYIFLIFALIAEIMNLFVYHTNIANGETFNMFFISPYYVSTLPVYDIVQQNVPYIVYLLFYLITIFIGGLIVYSIGKLINKFKNKEEKNEKK